MASNMAVVAGVKRPMVPAVAAALSERFGARYVTSMAVREHHGRDESAFDITPPDAVVFALSTEDVAFVLSLANRHGTPVTPMAQARRSKDICSPCKAAFVSTSRG
jgi:D-lactate dehydrogenase (cytochrome)